MNFNLFEYFENCGWALCGMLLCPLIQRLIELYKGVKADYDELDRLEDENEYLKGELRKLKGEND